MEGQPAQRSSEVASQASSDTAGGRSRKPRSRHPKGKGKETTPVEHNSVAAPPPPLEDDIDYDAYSTDTPPPPSASLIRTRERAIRRQKRRYGNKPTPIQVHPEVVAEVLALPGKQREPIDLNYNHWDIDLPKAPDPFKKPLESASDNSNKPLPPSSDMAMVVAAPPPVADAPVSRTTRHQHNMHPRLPHGSHKLGAQPNGPKPNHGGSSRVVAPRQFGAQLTNHEEDTSSGVPNVSQNRKGKQPERAPEGSNGNLRPDAPTFEPGKAAADLPPHLRAGQGRKPNPPAPVAPVKQHVPPAQSSNNPGPQRTRAGPSRQNAAGAKPNNRNHKHEPGFAKVETQGMIFPVIKNFKPHTSTFKGPQDIMTRVHKEIASGSYECMVCYGGITRKAKVWHCKCCWAVFHLHCIGKWAKQGLQQPPTRPIGVEGPPKPSWRCPACNNPNEESAPSLYTCWCEKTIAPEPSKYIPPHSCGQTCGKKRSSPKNCPHVCDLQCHAGPCPPCTASGPPINCFCGDQSSISRCADTDYENRWSCGRVCGDFMPCGDHTCDKLCHPGLCGECEFKENLRCNCGKKVREVKCCDKLEPAKSKVQLEDGKFDEWEGHFECDEICGRHFDCNLHRCGATCHTQELLPPHCPLSPDVVTHCPCGKTPLTELLPSSREDCDAPIPNCTKVCGKKLKCGHECKKVCHEGDCDVCLETSNISCRCGKTTVRSLCHQGIKSEPPQCMRFCRALLSCGRHECQERCCSGEKKAQDRLSAKKKMRPYTSGTPQVDEGFEPEHICTRPCGKPLKCGLHTCTALCHRGPCPSCLEASFDELTCSCGKTVIQPPVPCGSKLPECHHPCTRPKGCGHPAVPHECHTDDTSCPQCPFLVEKRCTCGKKTVKAVPCYRDSVSCGTVCGKKLTCGSHACQKLCHSGVCDEPCQQQCGKLKSCGHGCTEPCHAPFQCSEDRPCPEKIQLTCECGGVKQDAKCGASKANPAGNKKGLKCNDQCRSRRLAMALDLDPEREGIQPYTEDTIMGYNRDKKWAASVEKKFRAFAENPNQRRLQFGAMRKVYRQFLHDLSEDYGFESESQDPEPYRSVVVRKTNKFVASPRKTISEYLATLKPTTNSAPVALQQLKKPRQQVVNACVLKGTRVGLLHTDVQRELSSTLNESRLRFDISWYGDEGVLLEPKPSSLSPDEIEGELQTLLPILRRAVAAKGLADSTELCFVGKDGKIVKRESEGWSVVASKKTATASTAVPTATSHNAFDVLNSHSNNNLTVAGPSVPAKKSSENIKKVEKAKEVIVDDWEMAAEESEEEIF